MDYFTDAENAVLGTWVELNNISILRRMIDSEKCCVADDEY